MKEFHRDFANRTGLAQAWTVKSADRLFTLFGKWVSTTFRCCHCQMPYLLLDSRQSASSNRSETYPTGILEAEVQMHVFKHEWARWNDDQKQHFHGRWCYTVATSPLLITEQLKSPICVKFSGLGGLHVLEEPFVADLFVKCMEKEHAFWSASVDFYALFELVRGFAARKKGMHFGARVWISMLFLFGS